MPKAGSNKRGWRADSIRIARFKATIPFIDKPLTEITPDDWSTWRDSPAAGSVDRKPLAPGSIARDFNVIRAMCRIALDEWGWLKGNVLTRVKSPSPPPGKERVMSPKEVTTRRQTVGPDRWRIAILFIRCSTPGWKHNVALSHDAW